MGRLPVVLARRMLSTAHGSPGAELADTRRCQQPHETGLPPLDQRQDHHIPSTPRDHEHIPPGTVCPLVRDPRQGDDSLMASVVSCSAPSFSVDPSASLSVYPACRVCAPPFQQKGERTILFPLGRGTWTVLRCGSNSIGAGSDCSRLSADPIVL